MKITVTPKQIKTLASLREQNPDTEETLSVEPLVVNYRNYNSDNFRIYFNSIADVSREDVENSEQIILRSDGYDDFIINTNLLSFNYWPNISVDKRRIEITPEEELPSGNATISKLLTDKNWQNTEVGVSSKRKGFRQTVKQAIKDVWGNTSNWGIGNVPVGSSREPGVINFELACGTKDWSILNYFEGNTLVLSQLLIIYKKEVSDEWNRDDFLQWINENKKRLFGEGEVVKVLAEANRVTQCVGERRERLGEEWLPRWYEENGLGTVRIESGCPGDTKDRTCGQDMRIYREDGSVDYYQIKPLIGNVYESERWPYEVESRSLPAQGYPLEVNYLFISHPNSNNPQFIVFKNEGQYKKNGLYNGKIGFKNPPVQSPTELESNIVESILKIKLTEQQVSDLSKNTEEERRIKTMLKDMVGRAPWLVEEGYKDGFFGGDFESAGILVHQNKTKYEWEREVMKEIVEPVYRLYGFNEDEKEFVFSLFKQNLANDPDHKFTDLIIPSPFPFKTGNFNVGGTHRVGELDGIYKKDIEKVFGPPTWDQGSADNKVKMEWVIKFPDGTIGTIYDYKQYQLEPDEIDYWSIGGRIGLGAYYVKKAMGLI